MTGELRELQRMTNDQQHANVDDDNNNNDHSEMDLTTGGRTYEELVASNNNNTSNRDSVHSELLTDESELNDDEECNNSAYNRRKSVGVFLTGRNSLSNWSTFGNEAVEETDNYNEEEEEELLENADTAVGRKSNGGVDVGYVVGGKESRVSSLETPTMLNKMDVSSTNINISQRRSHISSRQRSNQRSYSIGRMMSAQQQQQLGRRSSAQSNNLSHISSSSSSMGEDNGMGESWSPIRTSLDNSFVKKTVRESTTGSVGVAKSPKRIQSKSPVRSPTRGRVGAAGGVTSPTRSPLGHLSPNRTGRAMSPKKKSPMKLSSSISALSPGGTFSLREAEGTSSATKSSTAGNGGATLSRSDSRTKLALPSLSSSRKSDVGFSKGVVAPVPPTTTTQQLNVESMLSPERPAASSSANHERSPAPTPNSQRRVIKRFRASLPTANYLMPEDLEDSIGSKGGGVFAGMEEEREATNVATPRSTNRNSLAGMQEKGVMDTENDVSGAQQHTYKNEFEFPRDIVRPSTATLRVFHDQAIANGSPSHQYQLNRAGTNLLSLQEVILPSIAFATNNALKQKQAKAQRNVKDGMPDHQGKDVVDVVEACRKVVTKCTGHAMAEAGKAWREREEQREQILLERHEQDKQQRKREEVQAKKERKEQRALARKQRYENQKLEQQKNHPRNKEMWQEVAKLMMDIQKLEKEERLWKEALSEVDSMEKNFQPPEKIDLELLGDAANRKKMEKHEELCNDVGNANLESTATTLVQDVTLATERINWMLQSVSLAMEESDMLRKEAYEKYQYDGHKFYGYPKYGDSKGLFVALSMDDSFA
ncbi:predicted protein [Thalassiosira pseudonana CCMP1335]|uniref:Uncharacterized protein n=1 Tax=Thalassiosira pseudonana TaxID=35128 RepID=B8C936_THAPS|nr:predicted protein [Thalassiosira pseudonana CCMP1335]EED89981.1 predicted protein [Thalassiosira pseudonana CCMP1335]